MHICLYLSAVLGKYSAHLNIGKWIWIFVRKSNFLLPLILLCSYFILYSNSKWFVIICVIVVIHVKSVVFGLQWLHFLSELLENDLSIFYLAISSLADSHNEVLRSDYAPVHLFTSLMLNRVRLLLLSVAFYQFFSLFFFSHRVLVQTQLL